MRILIVDDSKFSRAALREHLAQYDKLVIEEAEGGIEALEKHRSFRPDIIFLDLVMPQPDGYVLLKVLTDFDRQVKVIITSGQGKHPSTYRACIEAGAFRVLGKPVTKAMAVKALLDILEQRTAGE